MQHRCRRIPILTATLVTLLTGCGADSTLVPAESAALPSPTLPSPVATPDYASQGYVKVGRTGYEIAYQGNIGSTFHGFIQVYIDQEPQPIDEEAFSTWAVQGYSKNTPRAAQFNWTKTVGSPEAPAGPLTQYTDPYGYTWGEIARTQNANWPFRQSDYPDLNPPPTTAWEAAARSLVVPPGVVQYNSINKNQLIIYTALHPDTLQPVERYFVVDEWGNRYIMKASNVENDTPAKVRAAFEAAVLPPGWRKEINFLPSDLSTSPTYTGTSNAMYQSFRDSADNSYDQIVWGSVGDSVAQRIGPPMPIFASPSGARLNGTSAADQLFGGPGNDEFHPLAGDDAIDGGDGFNTAFLLGQRSQHTVTTDGVTTIVVGPDGRKTLTRLQRIQFEDER